MTGIWRQKDTKKKAGKKRQTDKKTQTIPVQTNKDEQRSNLTKRSRIKLSTTKNRFFFSFEIRKKKKKKKKITKNTKYNKNKNKK